MHRNECIVEHKLSEAAKIEELRLQRELIYTIEQVVDQLICEENERPTEYSSLRNVPLNKEVEEKLEKAKIDYLNSE